MEKVATATKRPTASRSYIGTLNNPEGSPEEYLAAAYATSKFTYVGGQLEEGENKVPHIQFYLHCTKPMRLTQVKATVG